MAVYFYIDIDTASIALRNIRKLALRNIRKLYDQCNEDLSEGEVHDQHTKDLVVAADRLEQHIDDARLGVDEIFEDNTIRFDDSIIAEAISDSTMLMDDDDPDTAIIETAWNDYIDRYHSGAANHG